MKRDRGERREPPVKVGEQYDVEVEAIGSTGDGMARINGYVVFIKDPVEIGENCKVEITKVTAKVGFANLVK